MPRRPEVFISATTGDLGSVRQLIRDALLAIGCHPIVQDHFGPEASTVKEMLRERIAQSDAVIHVVGECYGAEPSIVDPGGKRRSYTQIEYDLAIELKKPLYVFLPNNGFSYDRHEPEKEEKQLLQKQHVTAIASGDHIFQHVPDRNELGLRVREIRFKPLPEIDTASASGSGTRFAVLLCTDIVGSTALKIQHGVPAYTEALLRHNRHFERISQQYLSPRSVQSGGDGFFAEVGSVTDAVRFALLFQEALRNEPWGKVRLGVRVGISAGEVSHLDPEGRDWLISPAADIASRVSDLAMEGQILLTRVPFDQARYFVREHPPVEGRTMPPLSWLAHGPYLLKGNEEDPSEIFEVGAEGLAPLTPPPDGPKAKRAIRPGEEETLGWRPAVGLKIPGKPDWRITERLGAGGFGEVWTGEHTKLGERRAFKFCFDEERLRALKREAALVRLLRKALGDRDDIVRLHELKLDAAPFYLESDLAPHGNLLQWADGKGGLGEVPLQQRIMLVARTATALAAAHSIGVLHKDIKPTNILIFDGPNGETRPRLVDFGIGALENHDVLHKYDLTAAGFTRATVLDQRSGTPTYTPPEYLAGEPYTIQGDIYGLGILLYQIVTAKPRSPLAPGWERNIADPLLREDIAACVDGDPARRLSSATELADRLSHLEERRAEIAENECLRKEAERVREETAAREQAEAEARVERLRAIRSRKIAVGFAVLAAAAVAGGTWAVYNQIRANKLRIQSERSSQMIGDAHESASRLVSDVLVNFQERLEPTGQQGAALASAQRIVDAYFDENEPTGTDDDSRHMRSVVLNSRGYLAQRSADFDRAEKFFNEALAIREEMYQRDSKKPMNQHNLAVSYDNLGDLHAALAIAIRKGGKDGSDEYAKALMPYRKSLELVKALAAQPDASPQWQHDLAVSYFKVGDALLQGGDKDAALPELLEGFPVAEKVASSDPEYAKWQAHLGLYCLEIGRIYALSDKKPEACKYLDRGKNIFKSLGEQNRLTAQYQVWLKQIEDTLLDVAD